MHLFLMFFNRCNYQVFPLKNTEILLKISGASAILPRYEPTSNLFSTSRLLKSSFTKINQSCNRKPQMLTMLPLLIYYTKSNKIVTFCISHLKINNLSLLW